MKLEITDNARRQLKRLPGSQREKARKAFYLLLENYRHPSLHSRKMSGKAVFEARIDYQYRFMFMPKDDVIYILAVGPHDTGLGKK